MRKQIIKRIVVINPSKTSQLKSELKENNISLKRIIPIVAIIIKAILYIRVFKRIITLLTR